MDYDYTPYSKRSSPFFHFFHFNRAIVLELLFNDHHLPIDESSAGRSKKKPTGHFPSISAGTESRKRQRKRRRIVQLLVDVVRLFSFHFFFFFTINSAVAAWQRRSWKCMSLGEVQCSSLVHLVDLQQIVAVENTLGIYQRYFID